jgi:hypothetical protein
MSILLIINCKSQLYLTYTQNCVILYVVSRDLLTPQDQLRYFPASVVVCKATEHPLVPIAARTLLLMAGRFLRTAENMSEP